MRYIIGWVVLFLVYIVTLLAFANIANLVTFLPTNIFIGLGLIIVPYITLGIYIVKFIRVKKLTQLVIYVVIPIISEKVIVFFIGWFYVANRIHGKVDFTQILSFIQSKYAPFFTLPYIIIGSLLSFLITFLFVRMKRRNGLEG